MHNWVEINLGALKRNYTRIKQFVGPHIAVSPVIKAEAYGHGLLQVATALLPLNPPWFAVSKFSEAVLLRDAGISTPILVLSGLLPNEYPEALEMSITPVVYAIEHLDYCEEAGRKRQTPYPIHVKVDTGMGRLGIREEGFNEFLAKLKHCSWIKLEGLMSHFADADDKNSSYPLIQIERFRNFLSRLKSELKITPTFLHISNSAGTLRYPTAHFNMVRPGIVLYGPIDFARTFEPVMTLKARILQIKEVPPNTPIGYGKSFITPTSMTIATVSVGYGDGYPRMLSNRGEVLIRGRRCPIVGRVSMNLITVDVTKVDSSLSIGEEVVLLGNQGGECISADELGRKAQTISYEIYCRIGSNPVKRYVES
ncbi:MAG: alanine racemase [Syntrophobacterales bacterium]|nr:alanine racemase [Syntrophobacterales bacterium]